MTESRMDQAATARYRAAAAVEFAACARHMFPAHAVRENDGITSGLAAHSPRAVRNATAARDKLVVAANLAAFADRPMVAAQPARYRSVVTDLAFPLVSVPLAHAAHSGQIRAAISAALALARPVRIAVAEATCQKHGTAGVPALVWEGTARFGVASWGATRFSAASWSATRFSAASWGATRFSAASHGARCMPDLIQKECADTPALFVLRYMSLRMSEFTVK